MAIIPEGEVFTKSEEIKAFLKESFNVKYAQRSPSHITLKMPFSYNEKKEERLIGNLEALAKNQEPFPINVKGIGRFGTRVIFVKIIPSPQLIELQAALVQFCKIKLKLDQELSDRNYTPHMTVGFKDIKKGMFWECYNGAKKLAFGGSFLADGITLLKRKEGKWEVLGKCRFSQ